MMIKIFPLVSAATMLAAGAVTQISPALAAGPDGAALFRQRCASCHSVDPAKPALLAPHLKGVVGRKAASTQFRYSQPLKNANLIWTKANLDKYLTAPAKMVPGTRMVISISDPAQRKAVLDYLATAK
jgi:cytochrome c